VAIDLLSALIERQAQLAVGASTTRGQRSGTVRALRAALADVPLGEFGASSEVEFFRALDRNTRRVQRRLPRQAASWGLARKSLNIFLRDCYYNGFLMRQFKLRRLGRFFEVPLDSVVAKELKSEFPRGALPRWPGVKHLQREDSALFQQAAQTLCRSWRLPRVHLDTFLWVRGRKSTPNQPLQRTRRKRRAAEGRR
jgi:hypothetical protein